MNVAVVGARGMLGSDLMAQLQKSGHTTVGFDQAELDITRPETLAVLDQMSAIDAFINCAAFTNVDGCETQRELAIRVNGDGPGHLARYCKRREIYFMHFSTDYVFDGAQSHPYLETDRPHPISVYGASKLLGEEQIVAAGGRYCILRTQWLYGHHGKNFVDTILKLAQSQEQLRVVDDQIGSLTYTVDLAGYVLKVLERKLQGTFHVANLGYGSWYEVACLILQLRGIKTPIVPVDSVAFPRPAMRPKNGRLNTEKITRALGSAMRPWQDALKAYLA